MNTSHHSDPLELLRLAQKRFSSLVRSLPIGIAVLNAEGRVETANSALTTLLAYEPAELIGKNLAAVLSGSAWQNAGEFHTWWQATAGQSTEFEAITKYEQRIPVDVTVKRLDSDGSDRLIATFQDVTQRRATETLKQEFYRMITHDIRSPLAAASAFLELLQDGTYGPVNDAGVRGMTAAMLNIERVLALADGLLQLDKLENVAESMLAEPLSVHDLLEESVAGMLALADTKELELTCDEMQGQTSVLGDRLRLSEVLVNLISNAISYSPAGAAVQVRVLTAGRMVHFEVRDFGPGIPEEERATVFDQFKRGSGKRGKGFGLGLTICKKIIHQHGGEIGCRRADGQGTIFWFEVPALISE